MTSELDLGALLLSDLTDAINEFAEGREVDVNINNMNVGLTQEYPGEWNDFDEKTDVINISFGVEIPLND